MVIAEQQACMLYNEESGRVEIHISVEETTKPTRRTKCPAWLLIATHEQLIILSEEFILTGAANVCEHNKQGSFVTFH